MSTKRLLFVFLCVGVIMAACRPTAPLPPTPTTAPTAVPATPTPAPTATSSVLPPDMNAAVPPRLLARHPAAAETLALDGALELVFDQPMDAERTAAAVRVVDAGGAPVAGTVSFPQPRVLRFQPAARLAADSVYRLTLAAAASSSLGQSLTDGLTLDFATVGPLAVTSLLPADGARDVAANAVITVIFNRPVVPLLTAAETAALPSPVAIEPAVAGRGEWVNTSVYVFRPTTALAGSRDYSVRVLADAVNALSATGAQLPADVSARFSVRPARIVAFGLASGRSGILEANIGYRNLPLDQPLRVQFDQPMEPAGTQAAVTLVPQGGDPAALRFGWNADNTLLTLTPTALLALNSQYMLTIDASAPAAAGGTLGEPLAWRATTVRPPSIASFEPADGSRETAFYDRFVITFRAPIDPESVAGRVRFNPPLRADAEQDGYYGEWDYTLRFYGLAPSTDYVVTIDPGISDPYGNAIAAGATVRFRTGPADPLLRFYLPEGGYWGSELALYRQGGPTAFWLAYRNIAEVDVALYTLPFTTLIAEQQSGNLYRWQDAAQLIRRATISAGSDLDRVYNQSFELQDAQAAPLPLGLYFIAAASPQIESYTDGPWDLSVPLAIVNANLTLKTTASEALIWLTDLDSGAPLPGVAVRLLDDTGAELLRATTDADGLIYRADLAIDVQNYRSYYAVTDDPAVYSFAVSTWSDGLEPWALGIDSNFYQAAGQPIVAVYTDRPLYRPGQTVSFKGIVRLDDDLRYALPTGQRARVEIYSFDEQVFSGEFDLSPYGTLSGDFTLADEATLGDYQINVIPLPGNQVAGFGYFGVAEYRAPTFAVDVTTARADYLAADGTPIPVTVSAQFFSGGSVVNGRVDWFARASDYLFDPGRAWQSFSFSNWAADGEAWYYGDLYQPQTEIASGSGDSDTAGTFRFDLPVVLAAQQGSQALTIEAQVTDVGGNAVSGRATAVVHSADRYVGVRSDGYIGSVGTPITVELATVDWDGAAMAGSDLTLVVYRREWLSVQEEDESGYTIWRSTVRETAVLTQTGLTTGADGIVATTFTPADGGEYRLAGRYSRGAQYATASTILWVAGSDFVPWRQSNDNTFDLVADSDGYRPGDTARILIASPFQGPATALVTVERGHIRQVQRLDLRDNSTVYELPITADMAPNVYFNVLVIKGVDQFNNVPRYRYGIVELTVARDAQALNVSITPAALQYGPGEAADFEIRVTDAGGRPVQAELSLALSDLAALSLAPRRDLPLIDIFYGNRWLGVRTALLLNRLIDETISELSDEFKGGGGGGGDFGIFDVREDFRDTAYWAGQVTTDGDGVARVTIDLPDNLTTWRLDARAVTQDDTLVGEATADIRTTKPLLVAPYTPRFFVVGDRTQVGTLVHNNTDAPLTAEVALQISGATLDGVAAVQTVTIPARQQAAVVWPLTIDADATRVDAVFSASAGDLQDASRPPRTTLPDGGLPVYRYTVPETVGTSGQLLTAGATIESLALPLLATPVSGAVTVQVAPSLAAALTDGLTWLAHYPYECTEQLVSRFLPNVVTAQALDAAGLSDPALAQALAEQVNLALQRLYSRQQADGGWPWWEAGSGDSDTLVTAYVVLGLLHARDAGYDVSAGVLDRGVSFLQRRALVDRVTDTAGQNRQAFIYYVLAHAGAPDAGQLTALYAQREGLALYARAFLAQALAADDAADPRLATLLAELVSAAKLSASGAHWEEAQADRWNWNSDTRTTAIVLGALTRLDPDNPLVANGVRWLMAHRTDGRWASTQETAWTLLGLTDWMVASGELEADFLYEVALNGTRLGGDRVTAANLRTPAEWQIDAATLTTDGLNRLAIGRDDGPGNLYYSAYMRLDLPVTAVAALDRGIGVSRSYFRADNPLTPVTSAAQGETLLARLTLVVPTTRHYVVVDDWLPAGLEAVDTSLLTSSQAVQPDDYDSSNLLTQGWGWWWFDHVQLRDERVVLAADELPPGTYEYVYLVRAGTPGTYQVIPPSAQEFYFPDVSGHGAGGAFTVTP